MTLSEFILKVNLNSAPPHLGGSGDSAGQAPTRRTTQLELGWGQGVVNRYPAGHSSSDPCLALQSPQTAKFCSLSADEDGGPASLWDFPLPQHSQTQLPSPAVRGLGH